MKIANLPAVKLPAVPTSWMIVGGAVLAVIVYSTIKGAKSAGESTGGGAVDFASGVLSGGVIAIGANVGIPATNETECEKAKREGRTWDASFACTAGDFIKYVFN